MADPNPLTRNQIARFVGNDPEAIRAIERLFAVAGDLTPADIAALKQLILDNSFATGAADNKAEAALSKAFDAKRLADLLATAPIREAHNSVATDYVDLNVNAPLPADIPGRVYWNLDDGTVDVDLYNGSVLQVGQETHFFARNTSGGLVAKGTPVMFTGTVGVSGKLEFGLAVADGSVPADYMMGVTDQDIANNEFGYVLSFGSLRGFNTTGTPYGQVWADGDLLYFDAATPGAWTNVLPAAPSIAVPVAVVVNAAPGGAGSIFVRMRISQSLNTLQDVFINGIGTPADKDLLEYNAANSRWENVDPGTISVGNAATATALQTARTIGGVSFDGTANIDLPGVNQPGNQDTSGNAATATALQTARLINGTSFDGTADITTANWGTARTIWGQSINGSANITAPVRPAAGSASAPAFSTSGDTNTGIFFPAADTIAFSEGGAEAFRLDSSGRIVINNPTSLSISTGGNGRLQNHAADGAGHYTQGRFDNSGAGSRIQLYRSRSGTIGGTAALPASTSIGTLDFVGDDGAANYAANAGQVAARINGETNGTVSAGVVPGALTFWTANTAGVLTERLRIDSAGNVGIATTSPATALDVNGTANATNLTRGGSQVYSRDNIVGTVSQASGVPTGEIIERGSNANGDYVRFADGTQICWNNQVVTPVANTYTSYTWTFPAAFSVTPSITVSANSAATAVVNTQFSSPSATSANIGINRTNTTNTTLSSQAIGRWF